MYKVSVNDEFICKIAETLEEINELMEAGFSYVTGLEDKRFLRKRH